MCSHLVREIMDESWGWFENMLLSSWPYWTLIGQRILLHDSMIQNFEIIPHKPESQNQKTEIIEIWKKRSRMKLVEELIVLSVYLLCYLILIIVIIVWICYFIFIIYIIIYIEYMIIYII